MSVSVGAILSPPVALIKGVPQVGGSWSFGGALVIQICSTIPIAMRGRLMCLAGELATDPDDPYPRVVHKSWSSCAWAVGSLQVGVVVGGCR